MLIVYKRILFISVLFQSLYYSKHCGCHGYKGRDLAAEGQTLVYNSNSASSTPHTFDTLVTGMLWSNNYDTAFKIEVMLILSKRVSFIWIIPKTALWSALVPLLKIMT